MPYRSGTLLLTLTFALTACWGGGEAESVTETVSALPEGRTVNIDRINISPDARTITLGFLGHAHPEGSPCSSDYEGWARINRNALDVAVVVVARESGEGITEGTLFCTNIGRPREVDLELAEPFTGSEIRDVAGYFVLFLTAPEGLAELTGLPEGWKLRTESDLGVPFGAWSRVYSPVVDRTSDDPRVEFVQARDLQDLFSAGRFIRGVGPPDFGFDGPTPVTVGRVQGSLYSHPESGDLVLVWRPGDDQLVLVVNQRDFTVEALMALAEGTRVQGP